MIAWPRAAPSETGWYPRMVRTSSLQKKVFEVCRSATLIQDPSARRTKDSQPSGFGFECCALPVRFRVFQQTARWNSATKVKIIPANTEMIRRRPIQQYHCSLCAGLFPQRERLWRFQTTSLPGSLPSPPRAPPPPPGFGGGSATVVPPQGEGGFLCPKPNPQP